MPTWFLTNMKQSFYELLKTMHNGIVIAVDLSAAFDILYHTVDHTSQTEILMALTLNCWFG